MELLLFAVLFVLGAWFILRPLFLRGGSVAPGVPRDESEEVRGRLLKEKDAIYVDLKDLEFEFATGKLSEEDYAELRQAYRVRALDVLERIGESAEIPEGEGGNGRRPPEAGRGPRPCPACGEEADDPRALYCAACGASLSAPNVCPSCGAGFGSEDRFCGACGGARSEFRPAAAS